MTDTSGSTTPRLPAEFRDHVSDDAFDVSELVSDSAGAHSPFGNTVFPLPVEALFYMHPRPADRPNLAGDN